MANTLSVFNLQWYLDQNDDVKSAVNDGSIGGFEHFLRHGQYEGRSPGPLFDSAAYLSNNPDVGKAVEAGEMTAYEHFINYGASEGRSPISLFDAGFYLQQNSDVSEAVDAGHLSAVEHFLLYGQNEARAFSPSVDLGKYMSANPDVAKAVEAGDISAMEHLLLYGVEEGRDLGNGVNLGIFSEDPKFAAALEKGDIEAALGRVADVAPFLPSFQQPAGWTPATDTPIPVDFTPPEGVKLVVPDGVVVPDDMDLPDTFEPIDDGGETTPTPPAPKEFTLAEAMAAENLPAKYILTDAIVDLGVLAVEEFEDAQTQATAVATLILEGAINADELEPVSSRYTLQDTAENLTEEDDGSTLIELAHGAEKLIVTEGNLNLRNDESVEGTLIVELAGDEGQEFIIPDNEDLFVNVTGSDANDVIRGHDSSAPSQTFIADGGAGSDVLRGGTGLSELSGGDGYDTVFAMFSVAGGGSNLLFAGQRTEMDDQGVYAEGANAVSDSDANTYARGFFNPNLRNEVNEANVLQGGAANDIMVASEVEDIFYYQLGREHGQDTIHQFTIGEDHISVVGRLVNSNNPGSYQDIVFTSAGDSAESFAYGSSNSVPNFINAEAAGWEYDAENSLLTLKAEDLIAYIEATEGDGALPDHVEYGNFNDISIELVGIQGGEELTVSDFFSDYSVI